MTPAEVGAYLHAHIPMSAAIGVQARVCTLAGATLIAPLATVLQHAGAEVATFNGRHVAVASAPGREPGGG